MFRRRNVGLVLREQNDEVHHRTVQLYPIPAGVQGHSDAKMGIEATSILSRGRFLKLSRNIDGLLTADYTTRNGFPDPCGERT